MHMHFLHMQKKAVYVGRTANSLIPSSTTRILSFHLNNKNNCFHKQNVVITFSHMFTCSSFYLLRGAVIFLSFSGNMSHRTCTISWMLFSIITPWSVLKVWEKSEYSVLSYQHTTLYADNELNLLMKEQYIL